MPVRRDFADRTEEGCLRRRDASAQGRGKNVFDLRDKESLAVGGNSIRVVAPPDVNTISVAGLK